MLTLFSGGLAEVVDDFKSKCPQYFMNGIPPTVPRGAQYKQICQTLNDTKYYATLYDTNNKIPVYSAYKYIGKEQCKRPGSWYIEPQLEDNKAGINMELKGRRVLNNQASNDDYENSGYHKGHLAPVCHAVSQACVNATFTLTNAAPQDGSFNSKWYQKVERIMVETLKKHGALNNSHIVTGVVPGNNIIKNRVRVPSHFWSAYCCKNETNQLISGGFIGENSKGSIIDSKTVKDLETELKNLYQVESFFLFDNNCRDAGYVPVIQNTENNYVGLNKANILLLYLSFFFLLLLF